MKKKQHVEDDYHKATDDGEHAHGLLHLRYREDRGHAGLRRRKKEHRMSKKYGDDPRFMVLSELEGVTDEEAATEEKWWQNTAICGAMRATAITRRADDETRVQPII